MMTGQGGEKLSDGETNEEDVRRDSLYEHEIVGWSEATLELDDEDFAYAGKFRVPSGKAVTRVCEDDAGSETNENGDEEDRIVAALSFSPDRADDDAVRVRYFVVRNGMRGEGVGSALLGFAAERLLENGRYDAVRVSVNNPFSYTAARKAGFGWTGETAGLAELVMERPRPRNRSGDSDGDADRHERALRLFADRDLSDEEEAYVRRKLDEVETAEGNEDEVAR